MKTYILTLAATLMLLATACNQNNDIPMPVQKQDFNQAYEMPLYEEFDEEEEAATERIKPPSKQAGTLTAHKPKTKGPKLEEPNETCETGDCGPKQTTDPKTLSHSETGNSIERVPHHKQPGQLIPYTPKDPNAISNSSGYSTERTSVGTKPPISSTSPGSCADLHRRYTIRVMFDERGVVTKDGKSSDYLIKTRNGETVYACNLPAKFKSEGAKVIFTAAVKQQYPYEKWAGTPVKLADIKTDFGRTLANNTKSEF